MALAPLGSGWALCCASEPAVSVGVAVLLLQRNAGERGCTRGACERGSATLMWCHSATSLLGRGDGDTSHPDLEGQEQARSEKWE